MKSEEMIITKSNNLFAGIRAMPQFMEAPIRIEERNRCIIPVMV